MSDEKKRKRYLRKRRMNALRHVLCCGYGAPFRADWGRFIWLTTAFKAVICLTFDRVDNGKSDRVCLVSYDQYFNIDHYDWTSVFINPNWFKDWYVSIEIDGE